MSSWSSEVAVACSGESLTAQLDTLPKKRGLSRALPLPRRWIHAAIVMALAHAGLGEAGCMLGLTRSEEVVLNVQPIRVREPLRSRRPIAASVS